MTYYHDIFRFCVVHNEQGYIAGLSRTYKGAKLRLRWLQKHIDTRYSIKPVFPSRSSMAEQSLYKGQVVGSTPTATTISSRQLEYQ